MSTVRCVLRIGGDPIAKLDYFAVVNGQHENGKARGTKHTRRLVKGSGGWTAVWASRHVNNEKLTSPNIMLFLCLHIMLDGEEF